jgi:hypothetical protein
LVAVVQLDWDELAHENKYPDIETMMRDMYLEKKMTQEEIGLELNVSARSVSLKMREFNISVRKTGSKLGEKRGPRLPRGY